MLRKYYASVSIVNQFNFFSFCKSQNFSSNLWFKNGLNFSCVKCGRCCTGRDKEPININVKEAQQIAKFKQLKLENFVQKFVKNWDSNVGGQLQINNNKSCIFYDNKQCSIYSVRPTQCKIYPFFVENIITQHDWEIASQECPGIQIPKNSDLNNTVSDQNNTHEKQLDTQNIDFQKDFQRNQKNQSNQNLNDFDVKINNKTDFEYLNQLNQSDQQKQIPKQEHIDQEFKNQQQQFENVPYQIVTQLSLIQELNRGQEFPEYDIHDFAQSLEELEGDMINSWIQDVFQNNQRIIRFENQRFRVVDNFLPGHPPHRALVMRDSMAYSQTEVLLVNTKENNNNNNVHANNLNNATINNVQNVSNAHVQNADNVTNDSNTHVQDASNVTNNNNMWQIQHSGFASKGHQCMSFGVPLLAMLNMHEMCDISNMQFRSLVIGGAGCCLPLTLGGIFHKSDFEVVEIDQEIAEIAHNFFGAPKPQVLNNSNFVDEIQIQCSSSQNSDLLNSNLNFQVNLQNNSNSNSNQNFSQMSNKYSTLNQSVEDVKHCQNVENVQNFQNVKDVENVQNVKVIIDDGINFVKNLPENVVYDIIFVDAADSVQKSGEILSCISTDEIYGDKIITAPPFQFLKNTQFWSNVQKCLNNKNGILVVNVLGPMGYINSILKILKKNFGGIVGMQFLDDKQLYLFCSHNEQIEKIDLINLIKQYNLSQQLIPVLYNQFINNEDEVVKIYNSLGGTNSSTELS